tara:strand:+ start:10187 stop:10795 length:609 start_codon:yes stop_codon:yes gene_type:complete
MSFKPNFEINFKPSRSSFMDDNKQGLTHAAGVSTEIIILGEGSEELQAKINPYDSDGDFLEGEGRIRDKVREDIQNGVKEELTSCGSDCEQNDKLLAEANGFIANLPDEVGKRKMSSKARKSIARGEAGWVVKSCEAKIAAHCLSPKGGEGLDAAEQAAQDAMDNILLNDSNKDASSIGKTAIYILGGAVVLGGILFFAIRK